MKRNKKKVKQSLHYLNKRLVYIVLTGVILIATMLYIANLGDQNEAVNDSSIPQKEIIPKRDKKVHKASDEKNIKTLTDDVKSAKSEEETDKKEPPIEEKDREKTTEKSKVEPNWPKMSQEEKSEGEPKSHSERKKPEKEESKKEEKKTVSDKNDHSSSNQAGNKKANNDDPTNNQTSPVSDSKTNVQKEEKPVQKAEKPPKQASGSKEKSEFDPLSEASSSEIQALSSLDPMGFQAEVLRLVNIEREKIGLNDLTTNSTLNNAAMKRAEELQQTFSHTRPDGSDFSTVLSQFNITYYAAGENIAMNYPLPEAVVDGWMNSPGHKANILNERFTQLGVGVSKNDDNTYQWVQIFIGN